MRRLTTSLLSTVVCWTVALPVFLVNNSADAAPETVPAIRPLKQSPLVTGNGLGYAVLSTEGEICKLYAHPYRFERPNPDPSKDGFDTANFIKQLSWTNSGKLASKTAASPAISYLSESQVLSVKAAGKNDIEHRYFMPFGLKRNALMVISHGVSDKPPSLKTSWLHAVAHEEVIEVQKRKVLVLQFKDVKESLCIVQTDPRLPAVPNSKSLLGFGWAFIGLENPAQAKEAVADLIKWQGGLSDDALVEREIKEHELWRKKPAVTFVSDNEKKIWRQNETFIRMAQIKEPNTSKRHSYGLILASLPDGMWFTPWVRDMAYAVVGLVKMGHYQEAKEGLLSWFNARPVGIWKKETRNLDYQISVTRYFGDGSEEADYSGLQTPNVEFDDWGLALWAVSEYVEATHDIAFLSTPTYRGKLYETMRDFVVSPLLGNLDKFGDGLIVTADSSLWEEHQQNKKHFAFSTFSCINGLRGFLKIAKAMKDEKEVKLVSEKLALMERGFQKAFVHDGVVWGVAVEKSPKSEIDGSLLEAFNMGIVTDPAVREKTIKKMELLKTPSGGYKRLLGPSDYEKQEFVFIDFHMARCLLSMGKKADAQKMIDRIVDKSCQDHGLIAECYVSEKSKDFKGEIGDPTGSIPMVGYGAGIYAMTLLQREKTK